MARTDQLSYAQNPGLAHSDIYPIQDLLEPKMGLVLWTNDQKIAMTQGNNWISERSFSKDPLMLVRQSP